MKTEIRIDRERLFAVMRDAGILPAGCLLHHVTPLIVWENNTTEALFDPSHGGDGLLLKIDMPMGAKAPYDHACVGCGRFFTRMALCDGRGVYLGHCIDCDQSKDPEVLERVEACGGRLGEMPGSAFR